MEEEKRLKEGKNVKIEVPVISSTLNLKTNNQLLGLVSGIEELQEIRNIFDNVEKVADKQTAIILKKLLDTDFTSIEDFKSELKKLEQKTKYALVSQNAEMNGINSTLGNYQKTKAFCVLQPFSKEGTVKTETLEYKITDYTYFKANISISTSKLFVYAVSKINFWNNKSQFSFTDYAETRRILKDQQNRNKIQNDLKVLKSISEIKYSSKKGNHLILDTMVYKAEYDNGKITIEWNPEFAARLKDTYLLFPKSLMRLNGKEYNNTYILGWYIFTQLRINTADTLTRSVNKCLEQLSLPSKEKVRKTNRRYQDRIIEPFEKAIDTLNQEVPELFIEFDRCYDSIDSFLESNIKIAFNDNEIAQKYAEIKKKKIKKSIKCNKDKKDDNIKLCEKYMQEGKTKKEISKIMNVTVRTVERYISKIATKV